MVLVDEKLSIRTKRLLLRPQRLEDADDIFLLRSNALYTKFTGIKPETSVDQTREWITVRENDPDAWIFSIELLPTEISNSDSTQPSAAQKGRVIGGIGAYRVREVGYGLHPDFWGQGLATEALEAFLPIYWEHLLQQDNSGYIKAEIDSEHVASRRIVEKCGFQLWEYRKGDYESKTLGTRDTVEYRMPRPGSSLNLRREDNTES
ncbi:acyl-CoA N-acyltransferase [Patellaria atrata CBS 101060]|uniref:Acyl-CoA N-acyltransferase n=1 Tax=Patellaria atrata CBS 101060 TaxID=1346257 RepID=A0A9P4VMZ2_9PEZI|nr:acyl-CoA N-acyltransferase [Patellaria atrata CBS 101060]